jgi:8-oxo-dGTP diphosphatase
MCSGKVEFLLVQQFSHKDSWGVPKGHVNSGETLAECAVREVFEETGVSIQLFEKLQPAVISFKKEEKTVHIWLATPKDVDNSGAFHKGPHSEVADARWFSADSLPNISPYQQATIDEGVSLVFRKLRDGKQD